MEIQFLEPFVISFHLLNLKLAATAALRRAVAGHHDGWGSRWKDTLSFIYLPAHSRAVPLAEAPRLLSSIVFQEEDSNRKLLTQQEMQVKAPQSSNHTQ